MVGDNMDDSYIFLDSLNSNAYFHVTETSNLVSIFNSGLEPRIGPNSTGVGLTAKIFFVKGSDSVLKMWDVWLKWEMVNLFGQNQMAKKLYDFPQDKNWYNEFLSGNYKYDEEKKSLLFDFMFNYMFDRSYLMLDLKEGIDYSSNDIDENKVKQSKDKGSIKDKISRILYGDGKYSNCDSYKTDIWNMHTFVGRSIDKSKIKKLISTNGSSNVIDIVIEIYDRCDDKDKENFDLLNDYITYSKNKLNVSNHIK